MVLQRDRLHSKDFLNALSSSYEKVETFKTDLQALEDCSQNNSRWRRCRASSRSARSSRRLFILNVWPRLMV